MDEQCETTADICCVCHDDAEHDERGPEILLCPDCRGHVMCGRCAQDRRDAWRRPGKFVVPTSPSSLTAAKLESTLSA